MEHFQIDLFLGPYTSQLFLKKKNIYVFSGCEVPFNITRLVPYAPYTSLTHAATHPLTTAYHSYHEALFLFPELQPCQSVFTPSLKS